MYWGNPARNTEKLVINFGDSIGIGASCLRTSGGVVTGCGYIDALEQKLGGAQIANFSMARHTAAAEVASGFSIVRDSVLMANPGARRVYIHIGANDMREYLQENCSEFPLTFDPKTQTCDWVSEENRIRFFVRLESIAADVREIVEAYQSLGVREVVVGSFHPVEETGNLVASCANALCPDFQDYPCLNELSEFFSVELQNMVASLGGGPAGVCFADHLHHFPVQEPGACTIGCDCVHLNCYGHDVMAQIWYEALPTAPTPDG